MSGYSSVDLGLLILRLGFSALLIGWHGWARLVHAVGYFVHDQPWPFLTVISEMGFPAAAVFAAVSVVAGSLAPALVAVGLWVRPATLLIIGHFLVAVTSEAAKGDSVELPALYLLMAGVLLVAGPGRITPWPGSRPRAGANLSA
jgi:uncharacterized membrane protein YphA (DoxX/SURF4 family)